MSPTSTGIDIVAFSRLPGQVVEEVVTLFAVETFRVVGALALAMYLSRDITLSLM